jgi:hypothetical protein
MHIAFYQSVAKQTPELLDYCAFCYESVKYRANQYYPDVFSAGFSTGLVEKPGKRG